MTDSPASGPTGAKPGETTDIDLLNRSRQGDSSAYAELYSRYWRGAVRYAMTVSSKVDPEDVAAEAFVRVWSAMRGGGGPTETFRPYLHQAVRNVALNAATRNREVPTQPDIIESVIDAGEAEFDEVTVGFAEARHVAAAYNSLPDRWQKVLWLTQVDGLSITAVAERLDIRPNTASALLLRAREGLRNAWLEQQLKRTNADPECEWTAAHLASFVRGKGNAITRERVQRHLDDCPDCVAARGKAAVICASLKTVAAIGGVGVGGWLTAQAAAAAGGVVVAGQTAPLLMPSGFWLTRVIRETMSRIGSAPTGIGVSVAATSAAIVGVAAFVVAPSLASTTATSGQVDDIVAAAVPVSLPDPGSPSAAFPTTPASATPTATPPASPSAAASSSSPPRTAAQTAPASHHPTPRRTPAPKPTPSPTPRPPTPTPTTVPSPTPVETLPPEATPSPTLSVDDPRNLPTATWTPTGVPWPPAPTWTPTWLPTWTPSWPGHTPTPTPTPSESESSTPTPTPTETDDPSPSQSPTSASPTPTLTPSPSPSDEPTDNP